tara:strand:+ start:1600 stop:2262 length:663 start_codon:yes stop_codon:yes gene_type:complete
MKLKLLLISWCVLPACVLAQCALPAYTARYTMSMGKKTIGVVQDQLSSVDDHFRFVSDVTLNVPVLFMHYRDFITATSLGVVDKGVFQSQHFTFSERRKHQQVHHTVAPGQFDSQSLILSIRAALIHSQAPKPSVLVWLNKRLQAAQIHVLPNAQHTKTALGMMKTQEVTISFADGTQGRYWFGAQVHQALVAAMTKDPQGHVVMKNIVHYGESKKQCLF